MIKTLLATTIVFIATSAYADGFAETRGVVVDVEPVYSTRYASSVQEQCFEQKVPVYGYNQPSSGDVLAGALIGGAIGNQFGGGSGKDAMTVLGAIVGADAAGRGSNGVVGYTSEWRCQLVDVPQETRSFEYFLVTYESRGRYYQVETDQLFEVGQRIKIQN
jgi:uncharacterized protein YcfJ